MSDPYKVLGISRDATDEQVKEAYREMAKKYHPDNYQGSPIADLANEKMKEVNEAYDQIMNERKNRKNGGSSSQGYSGGYNPGAPRQGGCSGCDVCSGLLCADCCCECFGGDFIRCC